MIGAMRAASASAAALASASAFARQIWTFLSITAWFSACPTSPKNFAAFVKLFNAVDQSPISWWAVACMRHAPAPSGSAATTRSAIATSACRERIHVGFSGSAAHPSH